MATNAFNLADELHTHTKWMVILGSLWGVADVELTLEQGAVSREGGVCACKPVKYIIHNNMYMFGW